MLLKGLNILLFLGGLLLAFVLAEVAVRMFVPVRMVGSSFTIYDPIYGKRLKRNYTTTRITPEFTISFSTNSYAFRGPEGFPDRPILFLGDSFTMGYGVSDGEEFPALVRAALAEHDPVIPVVNTGMGANGNGRWIKFLRAEGEAYEPRAVVLQLMSNDFQDNKNERLFELTPNQKLIELPVPSIRPIRVLQNVVDSIPGLADSHLLGLIYQIYLTQGPQNSSLLSNSDAIDSLSDHSDQLTYRILDEVIAICSAAGWPMLAIVVGIHGERLTEIERRLKDNDIPMLRTPDRQVRPDLYYVTDGHWNQFGHALVAEAVLAELRILGIP
ncbi:MAG: hypothetical protein CL797_08400 [Chromatiales bacterium]|nr:hypothetical protein [Chromatiales bacterium]